VLQLLHILEKRNATETPTLSPGKDRAWKKYQEKVTARVKRPVVSRVPLVRAASVILVVGLLTMGFATQAKAESLWERVAQWTNKFFSFTVSNPLRPADEEYIFRTDNEGLQQVYDAVVEMGITDPVVPMWLPDGYELIECVQTEDAQKKYITAHFSKENTSVILNYIINTSDRANQYPKDEAPVNIIELFGDKFNILQNQGIYVAVWTKNKTENYLTIDCQEDTLLKVLESIYVWGDNP
jgi:hypothetical protein